MKKLRILCVFAILTLAVSMVCSVIACDNTDDKGFVFDSKMSFSYEYKEIKSDQTNGSSAWREGMVSGNGLQGFITNSDPYEDTLIYQNIHFILPNKNMRTNPVSFDELDTVRQQIVAGQNITDDQSYDDVYMYHAGGILRISQKRYDTQEYMRYTDYDTAQVGVRYTDKNGQWQRTSFTSQSDDINITGLSSSSTGAKLNLTLSFDNISTMTNYGKGNETDLQYKKLVGENSDYIAFVAHYPDYENSELKKGGYATVCYVICEGGTKETVMLDNVPDAQYVGQTNPAIKISNADRVYILAVSDRTFDMGNAEDFAQTASYELTEGLLSKLSLTADKYTSNGKFNYNDALSAHTAIFTPMYNSVEFSLGAQDNIPNEKLLKNQRLKDDTISSDLAQKAYYSGRYAYLCCAGYSTSRLYGMWTGEWNCGWGSKYTMDANVNLQTSSMNTSNIISAPLGYVNFILRQADDWEDNAYATHGYTDAIQAPVNSDGDRAIFTESCYPYPFRYWNAGASWMLQPLYETVLCYGDLQIPINDEFSLQDLKSVLSTTPTDLTENQIKAFEKRGYLNLKEDILLPLLIKSANYWQQLLTPEYYTDANGYIHYQQGKTQLEQDETYCIVPSYSPENNPSNYPSPACANATIDISACRSNLEMLIDIMTDIDSDADVSKWQNLLDKLPPILLDDTGAIKEWSTYQFEENNEHRHLSHLYCVWPLDETQSNQQLKNAAIQAIKNRASENNASHALVHRTLIADRLKDRESSTEAMLDLMSSRIYYDSLMTNHDTDKGSAYCTDYAIGYLGMINEGLVYSDKNSVEILPCLPLSGFDKGSIKGLRLKIQAVMTNLQWDLSAKTATVTIMPEKDTEIVVSSPLAKQSKKVSLKKGESMTIQLTLDNIR